MVIPLNVSIYKVFRIYFMNFGMLGNARKLGVCAPASSTFLKIVSEKQIICGLARAGTPGC